MSKLGARVKKLGILGQSLGREFLERISEPMLYFHGDKDDSVPFEWSQKPKNLKDLNKNVSLIEYRGQPHEFTPPTWNIFMNKSAEFFKQNLK